MHELTFKHRNKIKDRMNDILVRETFEKNGVAARTERRCFYFIKDVMPLSGEGDLRKWINGQDDAEPVHRRHFHILKGHDEGLGEDKLICKIAGTFYAVVDKNVYNIAFLHSFKVSFLKVPMIT